MCTVVKAGTFFAIVLSEIDRVSCELALDIRDRVEKKNPDIIIDISSDSVIKAQKRYPYLFNINSTATEIERNSDFSTLPKTYFTNEFYNSLGNNVLNKIISEVKKAETNIVQRKTVRA